MSGAVTFDVGVTKRPRRPSPRVHLVPAKPDSAVIEQEINRLIDEVIGLAPHLASPLFRPLLHSFCSVTRLIHKVGAKVEQMDMCDQDGELRRSYDTLMRMMLTQSRLANELGLTPRSLRELAQAAQMKPILDLEQIRMLTNGNGH